jgi:hypothetical protein
VLIAAANSLLCETLLAVTAAGIFAEYFHTDILERIPFRPFV